MNRFLYAFYRNTYVYRINLSLTTSCVTQTRHESNKKEPTPSQVKREKFWRAVNEYLDEIPNTGQKTKQNILKKKMRDEEIDKLSLEFMNAETKDSDRTKKAPIKPKDGTKDSEPVALKEVKDEKWRLALNFLDFSEENVPLKTYRGNPITGSLNSFKTFKRNQNEDTPLYEDFLGGKNIEFDANSKMRSKHKRNHGFSQNNAESIYDADSTDGTEFFIETRIEEEEKEKVSTEIETMDETEATPPLEIPEYRFKDASIPDSINEYLPGIGTKSDKTGIASDTMGDVSFEEMLRTSNLMLMGDPRKKNVTGIVFNISGDQIYVDYGHKFYGVFKIPEDVEKQQFQPGTKVVVKVNELELTQQFLGENTMFSLLESSIEFVALQ